HLAGDQRENHCHGHCDGTDQSSHEPTPVVSQFGSPIPTSQLRIEVGRYHYLAGCWLKIREGAVKAASMPVLVTLRLPAVHSRHEAQVYRPSDAPADRSAAGRSTPASQRLLRARSRELTTTPG